MLKKFAILGLVLLIVGAAAVEWGIIDKRKEQQQLAYYKQRYNSQPDEYIKQYNEWLQLAPEERALAPWMLNESGQVKKEAQLKYEQQERLKADLDKLAAGEIHPSADILYGKNWQNELRKYKKQKELREFLLTSSIALALTGAAISTCCLLLWTSRLLIRVLSRQQSFQILLMRLRSLPEQIFTAVFRNRTAKDERHKQKEQLDNDSKLLINSGWHNCNENYANQNMATSTKPTGNESCLDYWNHKSGIKHPGAPKIAMLLSDKKSSDSEETLKAERNNMILNTKWKSSDR